MKNTIIWVVGIMITGFLLPQSFADIGDIKCQARYQVVTEAGTFFSQSIELKTLIKNKLQLQLEGELEGRTLILNGDLVRGDFTWSQIWGPGFTEGIRVKGSFDSSGDLALYTVSTVDVALKDHPNVKKGSAVYKLECVKTLASQFPNE